MNLISEISKQYFRSDLPELKIGDKVEVITKNFFNSEKSTYRLTHFKGLIISQKRRGQVGYTFSVLKESSKVAIRNVFLYHSPLIVEIKKLGHINQKVRRAKLYYLERKLAEKKSNE